MLESGRVARTATRPDSRQHNPKALRALHRKSEDFDEQLSVPEVEGLPTTFLARVIAGRRRAERGQRQRYSTLSPTRPTLSMRSSSRRPPGSDRRIPGTRRLLTGLQALAIEDIRGRRRVSPGHLNKVTSPLIVNESNMATISVKP
jgi:hypothetical protein